MKRSTKDAIDAHVREGRPCGDFVTAVLMNDLKEAYIRADDDNRRDMQEIVGYCYNNIPHPCWGSPDKVYAWRRRFDNDEET